jgi:hypothetical protein
MDWLWPGNRQQRSILSRYLAGGILLGWLKAKRPTWAPPFLYGLVGATLILGILVGFKVLHALSLQPSLVEQGKEELVIRQWLDNFHFSATKVNDPESSLALLVGFRNGTQVAVRRLKMLDHYITIQGVYNISPTDMASLRKLSANKRLQVQEQLILEATRQKIGFTYQGDPIQSITLETKIPITPNLNESSFINGLDNVDISPIALRESFAVSLASATK